MPRAEMRLLTKQNDIWESPFVTKDEVGGASRITGKGFCERRTHRQHKDPRAFSRDLLNSCEEVPTVWTGSLLRHNLPLQEPSSCLLYTSGYLFLCQLSGSIVSPKKI